MGEKEENEKKDDTGEEEEDKTKSKVGTRWVRQRSLLSSYLTRFPVAVPVKKVERCVIIIWDSSPARENWPARD